MQFVVNGPDIPDDLLQAHEEGRVVFFCGAGISYKVGLKDFKWLVEDIYSRCGATFRPIEKRAYDNCQYDTTLNLLEDRLPNRRLGGKMRRELACALQPNLRRKGATDTHRALLQLARNRKDKIRLVTTNFDRSFEKISRLSKSKHRVYAAPMLPVPKNSHWDGIVYLHGLLPETQDEKALDSLVVTSGDFGLAYLTERWASRFVSELFRNYVVCFVGYGINDPVLRYMMDALAADRLRGEVTQPAYALGGYEPGGESEAYEDWKAKGVTPILYDSRDHHSLLHNTLRTWADDYRNGVQGKERIVVAHAISSPSESTKQDDFVGRMLWAITDKSGLPAKHFANFNPVPPIKWLYEAFSARRFKHADLSRFLVVPNVEIDPKLEFSIINRPSPYTKSQWMSLTSLESWGSRWDEVMFYLGKWITRHLNDPGLIIWLSENGGVSNGPLSRLIDDRLSELEKLERNGATEELDEIRLNSPFAIPTQEMRTLWRLMITGHLKALSLDLDLYRWIENLKRDGLTTSLRLELRKLLSPKLRLKRPYFGDSDGDDNAIQKVRVEIELAADHARSTLIDIDGDHWRMAAPFLIEDFQGLLRDALDILREVGLADDQYDSSQWDLPSISAHWQNRGYRDWVLLIEQLRDSWIAVYSGDPERARSIALGWYHIPYPTFKRLALFAATHNGQIHPEEWAGWLCASNGMCLWSTETKREVMRLLVTQGASLTGKMKRLVEAAILKGPPRRMYSDELSPEDWKETVDHAVWLRLSKLTESGLPLSRPVVSLLKKISADHKNWILEEDQRDEFSSWMYGTGDPGYENENAGEVARDHKLRKKSDWLEWLRADHASTDERELQSFWRLGCQNNPVNTGCALLEISQEGSWPVELWRVALQTWCEPKKAKRSWRFASQYVLDMPNEILLLLARNVSRWLDVVAKNGVCNYQVYLGICNRVLDLPISSSTGMTQNNRPIDQPVTEAINHPIGHVAQALLSLLFGRGVDDGQGMPADVGPLLTRLCDTQSEAFRHGRVILASRLISLFRVDREWTCRNLMPLFNWSMNRSEAKGAWEGFLWSPRIFPPLLTELKPYLLDTANHYSELGEHGQQYSTFLTYVGLQPLDDYGLRDFQIAFQALPQEGLQEAARALFQALDGAGEQREVYWDSRIRPLWRGAWPQDERLVSSNISNSFALLAIAAGGRFPQALGEVHGWLRALSQVNQIVRKLLDSKTCSRFPADALSLLDTIISTQTWAPRELGTCLDQIVVADPTLASSRSYQRLAEYFRQNRQL